MSYIGYDVGFQKAFRMDAFTGTAGVSVYPLSTPKPLNERSILVVVDGIVQKPFYSYTLDSNSDLKFDGTTIGGEMITITHLGRPVTMGVPSDGSIVSSHFSNIDITFPANIQTGQGDELTFQYDSTTPTATQGIIWDRGGGTDVYLRYNPTTNILESNVTIGSGGGASSIDDLTDVDITTTAPTTGQVLVWNATNSEFEPADDVDTTLTLSAESIGALGDVDITTSTPADGEVLKWDAANSEFVPGVAAAALSYSSSTYIGNGTLAAYAIPTGHTVDDVLVYLNGVAQVPTTDYTIVATVLTFGIAPLTGQSIVFRFLPV